jgi:hypothetical protein
MGEFGGIGIRLPMPDSSDTHHFNFDLDRGIQA